MLIVPSCILTLAIPCSLKPCIAFKTSKFEPAILLLVKDSKIKPLLSPALNKYRL